MARTGVGGTDFLGVTNMVIQWGDEIGKPTLTATGLGKGQNHVKAAARCLRAA